MAYLDTLMVMTSDELARVLIEGLPAKIDTLTSSLVEKQGKELVALKAATRRGDSVGVSEPVDGGTFATPPKSAGGSALARYGAAVFGKKSKN
ncbi:MAG: hypothetical protein IJ991_11465, partial [Thermoguttaceae bacterium]|nr:hypothetical protein [Thermoguttaceae bacterium]